MSVPLTRQGGTPEILDNQGKNILAYEKSL